MHLLFAVATLGAWLGCCAARVRGWPNAAIVPGYARATNVAVLGVAAAGFGCNLAVASATGLDVWPLAAIGALVLSAAMVGGLLFPGAAVHLQLCMWIVAVLAADWEPDAVTLDRSVPGGAWAAVALACAAGLLAAFASQRFGRLSWRPGSLSGTGRFSGTGILGPRGPWEPSFVRVAALFGGLAVGAAVVQRVLGVDLRDESWMVLIGTLCANTGATGASVTLPRGPLAGASWLLLVGAAGRGGVGRRVQWKILGDSLLAVAVFAAATAVVGADFRLVEMLVSGFACCNAYLVVASRFRWLMASRLSGLVATPAVVALALAAWEYGPWGLPAAAAAWIGSGAVAVFAGGIGIGRLDLDFRMTREISEQ